MVLQSPLKKLPRREGGPGHEPELSWGPGPSGGGGLICSFPELEATKHKPTISLSHLNCPKEKVRLRALTFSNIYRQIP